MIPRANITAWKASAPWAADEQVEQDLVISRALVELFSQPVLAEQVAFRDGTALHKLVFKAPGTSRFDAAKEWKRVHEAFITLFSGAPLKGVT